ncbi:MAG: universal stress protein [Desulfovermiculus sp.]
MNTDFKSILFATNLSEHCAKAFNVVLSLASRYGAQIYILYVHESTGDYPKSFLKGYLGEEKWQELQQKHEDSARAVLIGKRSAGEHLQESLKEYCLELGRENLETGFTTPKILIREGDVIQEILDQAKENDCDLIVMAGNESYFSDNARIGTTIKTVMRKAHIPVLVVPPALDTKSSS